MSERILIPLDGSELGEAALRYVEKFVARLAPGEKVEVTLFHAISKMTHQVSIAGGANVNIPYSDEELTEMKAKAEEYLDRAGKGLRDVGATVRAIAAIGSHAAELIVKAEEDVGADLVAMSTHGRSGLSRWAFGSVTDRVLRHGRAPVLMVRAKEK